MRLLLREITHSFGSITSPGLRIIYKSGSSFPFEANSSPFPKFHVPVALGR